MQRAIVAKDTRNGKAHFDMDQNFVAVHYRFGIPIRASQRQAGNTGEGRRVGAKKKGAHETHPQPQQRDKNPVAKAGPAMPDRPSKTMGKVCLLSLCGALT
jgi:hypothetical protein